MVLLNTVLETAGQEHSFDEVGFLVKFLGDRLQDHVTVVPVLGSLRALVSPTTRYDQVAPYHPRALFRCLSPSVVLPPSSTTVCADKRPVRVRWARGQRSARHLRQSPRSGKPGVTATPFITLSASQAIVQGSAAVQRRQLTPTLLHPPLQSSSQEGRQQAFSVMLEITRNHSASLKVKRRQPLDDLVA